jgi:hypothetical protein
MISENYERKPAQDQGGTEQTSFFKEATSPSHGSKQT